MHVGKTTWLVGCKAGCGVLMCDSGILIIDGLSASLNDDF